jgi:hypothetical protein
VKLDVVLFLASAVSVTLEAEEALYTYVAAIPEPHPLLDDPLLESPP